MIHKNKNTNLLIILVITVSRLTYKTFFISITQTQEQQYSHCLTCENTSYIQSTRDITTYPRFGKPPQNNCSVNPSR